MADGAVIAFAAPVFKGHHLLVFALLDDFRGNFSAWGMTDLVPVYVHDDLERCGFTRFGVEQIDIDGVAFCDSILSSACFDDRVSHKIS
jgi:hypothetical protein